MPVPNTRYVAMFPLQEYFVDKDTGLPLAAGILTFYVDQTNRTIPKDVYIQEQQPDNTYSFLNIGSMITLSSVGTPQYLGTDFIPFMWPFDGTPDDSNFSIELYEVFVESSSNVEQFTREAWPPNVSDAGNLAETFTPTENAISNPQFVEVLFEPDVGVSTYTFNVSTANQETVIAPGWSVITTGSGTVIVEQLDISDSTAVSNPPYALSIQSTGSVTSLKLQQKFEESPRLFANGFINGSVVASSTGGVARLLKLYYAQSNGSEWLIVEKNTTNDNLYSTIGATISIVAPPAISTASAPTGYSLFYVILPVGEIVNITSLQLVGVQNISSSSQFLQEPVSRQIDHLFHYYKPKLEYKPIPSYLVGWDFPLNPAQALGPTVSAFATGANTSNYVWDQTIVFQSVNSGLTFARSTTTNGFNIVGAIDSQFAVIQYLEAAQARELLSQRNAVSLKGAISTGTIQGYVNIYWTQDATLPDLKTPNFDSLIPSLTAGVPPAVAGFNGTWVKVERDNLGDANFLLTTTNTTFDFSGWDATAQAGIDSATYIAIVVSFASLPAASVVTLDYVSLVGGDIATRPAPQTPDTVLQECEYYYEKSYDNADVPGKVTNAGLEMRIQSLDLWGAGPTIYNFRSAPFSLIFRNEKRSIPTINYITFYAPGISTVNRTLIEIYSEGVSAASANVAFNTNWTILSSSTKGLFYVPANNTDLVTTGAIQGRGLASSLWFQYTIDTRLGILL